MGWRTMETFQQPWWPSAILLFSTIGLITTAYFFVCVFLDQCLSRPLDCEVHKGRGHIACLLQDPAVLDVTAGMQQIFDETMNADVFCFCFLNIHDSVWTMI